MFTLRIYFTIYKRKLIILFDILIIWNLNKQRVQIFEPKNYV